jgi:hypothetical protein
MRNKTRCSEFDTTQGGVVTIEEGWDEGQDCFIVRTDSAVYHYQKHAGGFSSIRDRDGNDWINYKSTSYGFPGDAGGKYRGLPNLVHPENFGHPGSFGVESELTPDGSIVSCTPDRSWSWRWNFEESFARLTVERVPSGRNYWFLYEGTPGGTYFPPDSFWGTNDLGQRDDIPEYESSVCPAVLGNWRWVYFGIRGVPRVLLLDCGSSEPAESLFGYLGASPDTINSADGMVVFGFGRTADVRAALSGPMEFQLSFVESVQHETISACAAMPRSLPSNLKDCGILEGHGA